MRWLGRGIANFREIGYQEVSFLLGVNSIFLNNFFERGRSMNTRGLYHLLVDCNCQLGFLYLGRQYDVKSIQEFFAFAERALRGLEIRQDIQRGDFSKISSIAEAVSLDQAWDLWVKAYPGHSEATLRKIQGFMQIPSDKARLRDAILTIANVIEKVWAYAQTFYFISNMLKISNAVGENFKF